jgi:hypothetical protein
MSSSDARMDAALDALNNWYDDALKNGGGFKSDEERQNYLASLGDPEKHPMFAQNTEDLEGHPYVEALRAIKEEDKTPVELAIMYKEEGNEWMKKSDKKSLHEAYERYSHALSYLDKAEAARSKGTEEEKDQAEDLQKHRSQVLGNRAQCSLTLANYGSCKKDCDAAIACWAGNVKAHYRKCRALFLLKDYESCATACDAALLLDSSNKDLLSLLEKSRLEVDKIITARRRQWETGWETQRERLQGVWQLCQALGVTVGHSSVMQPEPMQLRSSWPVAQLMDGDDEEAGAVVTWPVLFLYPQYNKFDIMPDTHIGTMLIDQLAVLFPGVGHRAEWDAQGEYENPSNLVVYAQLDTAQEIKTEAEWLVAGLEYYVAVEGGNIEVMKLALQTLLDSNEKSIIGYSRDILSDLSVEYVSRLAEQRETSHNKKLQTIYDVATAQKPTLKYLEVNSGCSIHSILTANAKRNVLPRGVLSLIIFPRGSKSHKKFLKTIAAENFRIDSLVSQL